MVRNSRKIILNLKNCKIFKNLENVKLRLARCILLVWGRTAALRLTTS